MRKRTILSIIASLLFVLSCDDVNELIPDDNKVFALEKDSISLSWQEQSLKINVQTITDFTVSSNCDWISVTKQYSDEKSFIELSVDENPDTLDSRIGIITLVANDIDATATLHVTQGYNNINFLSLRKLLRENPKVSIFYSALVATHLADSLYKYIDESYPSPQYDSTYASLVETGRVAVEYETNWENFQNGQQQRVVWPDQRLFKYTVFVVTDSVLDREYGIKSLNDLEAKAREVYDNPDHINDSPELSTSPLYKLMSYHILPCGLNYNQLNPSGEEAVDAYLKAGVKNEMDIDAYYETMQPYAIMRISTPYDSLSENPGNYIYINRKGRC